MDLGGGGGGKGRIRVTRSCIMDEEGWGRPKMTMSLVLGFVDEMVEDVEDELVLEVASPRLTRIPKSV